MAQVLKRVRAGSLEEAYRIVRQRFGADAVVLNTAQANEGGFLGFFGRKLVELTVSVPVSPQGRRPSAAERKYAAQRPGGGDPQIEDSVKYFKEIVRNAQGRARTGSAAEGTSAAATAPVVPFPTPDRSSGEQGSLRREVQEIREMMQVLYAEHPGAGLPTEFAPHYRTLTERGVSRRIAAALLGAVLKNSDLDILRDPRVFVERLGHEIRRIVPVTGGIALQPGRRHVVALCGATGVGKTTNLAKLAAHFSVRQRIRVALVTADTYRIAAPEQLRVYANIIGIPMRVANDHPEMTKALEAFAEYDLVLVDTAGGSQFNLEQINELKHMLAVVNPHETMLVMGANTQLEDLRNVAGNFKCLSPTSVMFTKLDETRRYGVMLSALLETGLPLGYLSVGQRVPDDIRVASPGNVAGLILEGRENRG